MLDVTLSEISDRESLKVFYGTVSLPTNNDNWASGFAPVAGMEKTDAVVLSPHVTNGKNSPKGKGPLFCAFIDEKKDGGFGLTVYDIQAGLHNVTVDIDYVVIGKRKKV